MNNTIDEISSTGARLAGGILVFGLSPTDLAGLTTAFYFFIQALYILWKWFKESRNPINKA